MVSTNSLNPARSYQEAASRLAIDDLTENDRIAFAAMLGASRSHLAVASCPKNKDASDRRNIRIAKTGIACPDQHQTTKGIFDIFGTLVGKGLEIASFNFPGFPAQADPAKAQAIAGTQITDFEPGLHVFSNIDLTDEHGQTPMYPGSPYLLNVIKELSARAPGRRLIYTDSEHPPSRPYIVGEGRDLNITAANDTVRAMLGALCSPNDEFINKTLREQNIPLVGALLNGAGFGFGMGQNYNPRLVRFTELQNDEVASEILPEEFLGPLDRFDGDSSPVSVQTCFAGGKYGALELDELFGLRREIAIFFSRLKQREGLAHEQFLQEIADYYNQIAVDHNLGYQLSINDIKQSQIYQSFQKGLETGEFAIMSNRKLIDLIADSLVSGQEDKRDKLIHAMIVSLFSRQAQYLVSLYKEQFRSMRILAVAGSYAIDAVDRLSDVREAFMRPLKELNPDLHLFLHSLHGNDGLDNMAVDILRLSAGLVPARDQIRDQNGQVKTKGILARLWASIKSVFGSFGALFSRKAR